MANSTVDLVRYPYGKTGRDVNLPIDGGTEIFEGVMVAQLTATGMLVPGSTAGSGSCVGVSTHAQDNTTGADGALLCTVENDRVYCWANATSTKACSDATLFGQVVYMDDDHTISDNSVGGTLQPAGYFLGMEPDGKVRVYHPITRIGDVGDIGESADYSAHGVRGASTANVPNLAAFTVAAVDGLTYSATQRILLKDQTAPAENGIYVVGTVAGGLAPLTRALDADGSDEVIPGMVVVVSEGTAAADTAWKLDTNTVPIVVGTTGLVFTQIAYGFGAAGSMTVQTYAGASAGTGATASRIDHRHSFTTAAPTGAIAISAGAEGASNSFVRADHAHPCASAVPTGAVVIAAAGTEGVATTLARTDHAHPCASAAPTGNIAIAVAAQGVATTLARTDHVHGCASAVPTGAVVIAAAGTEGVATTLARTDHAHPCASAVPTGAVAIAAGAEGAATSLARSDHQHPCASAAPVATGQVNVEGNATTLARSNHVHAEHALEVRYVMTTNVANLAAFTVVQDGVTGVAGDLVLLANQTGGDESGVYVLGAVGGGLAPLTRVAWLPAAAVVRGGYTVHVEEGTLNASTSWFIAEAGAITIGTTAHHWYPESITQSVVLVAGTVTIANVPILGLTRTNVVLARQIANTSTLTVGGYHPTVGGATGLTAGVVGTAACIIEACVGAGTINNADISTLHATIVNR